MKQLRWLIVFLTVILTIMLLSSCSNSDSIKMDEESKTGENPQLFISAAASLTDALTEIKTLFEAEYNVQITYNFSGSGKLAQQIQQGAPADIFIAANEKWVNILKEQQLIMKESLIEVTGNKLVLIAGNDSPLVYSDFAQIEQAHFDQIAIGHPDSVPAGEYAKEVLVNLGKWDELSDHIVYAQDVRQVLTYVETGNADLGFVYESDAISSGSVKILAYADPSLHEKIVYPAAIVTGTKQEKLAEDYLAFLQTDEAQKIFKNEGFHK